MKFDDIVYGEKQVKENVLVELIDSRPVQRLKDINQAGPSPLFMDDKPVVKRYDHSIGVMLLLRENGASLEEQIAGLLHDIPHTAFSHIADFVFETSEHEYHERFMEEIVYSSNIPEILDRYGYSTDHVLEEDNYKLLERDLPQLCADRLDYSMRDLKRHDIVEIENFRDSLRVKDNEFGFDNYDVAKEFAERFVELDREVYANPREVAIHHLFAEILREMLDQGELDEEELFRTDSYVINRVRESNLSKVQEILDLLDSEIEITVEGDKYDFIGETKARAVDPPFLKDGRKIPISEKSDSVKKMINNHIEAVNNGFKIKVEGFSF